MVSGNTQPLRPLLDIKIVPALLEPVTLRYGGDDVNYMALVGELCGVVTVGGAGAFVLQKFDQTLHFFRRQRVLAQTLN